MYVSGNRRIRNMDVEKRVLSASRFHIEIFTFARRPILQYPILYLTISAIIHFYVASSFQVMKKNC